jgi:predicted O-methyltransferase YrrM
MKLPNRDQTERFVTALYHGVLRRAPDRPGLEHYVSAIQKGLGYAEVAEIFVKSEEYQRLTNPTQSESVKLFVPPGHFYSPIVNPDDGKRHYAALARAPRPKGLAGINVNRAAMIELWRAFVPLFETIPFEAEKTGAFRYKFDNPSYSWGDGSVLNAMLRHFRPKRLIEIGSGWSSACTLDTVQFHLNSECELTCIEPYPQLLQSLLKDSDLSVQLIRKPVQMVSLETFDALQEDDFLFIDSTHVLRTGSDVCYELFEIMPRLAPGVLVHIHDMFWPFEYPPKWALEENRSWSEIYAVRAFLTDNPHWRVLMFNDYLVHFERSLIENTYPAFLRNGGGALWLQKI